MTVAGGNSLANVTSVTPGGFGDDARDRAAQMRGDAEGVQT
jgi:hypothetical protein